MFPRLRHAVIVATIIAATVRFSTASGNQYGDVAYDRRIGVSHPLFDTSSACLACRPPLWTTTQSPGPRTPRADDALSQAEPPLRSSHFRAPTLL
jgi:hypothetical protein